jgi:hypothetical protein
MTKRRQGFAIDVLGDDHQRLALLHHRFEQGHEILDAADFLFEDQHVAILQDALHGLGVGHEVRRQIAPVELHAFDPLDLGRQAFPLVDRDHAVLAHLFHGVRQQIADLAVVVRGDRSDVGHRFLVFDLDGHLLHFLGQVLDRHFDALLHVDRVDARHDAPQALVENGFGQHRGGRRAVARHVAGLAGHFADHPGTHVLVDVLQVDLFRDRDAVLGHRGRSETLLQDDVAALGAEGHLDGSGQLRDPAPNRFARLLVKCDHFRHRMFSPCMFV